MGTRRLLVLAHYGKVSQLAEVAELVKSFRRRRMHDESLDDIRYGVTRMATLGCLMILVTLSLVNVSLSDDAVRQRADGCIVMDASQTRINDDRQDWTFELLHPGSLTLQLISSPDNADTDISTEMEVDGRPHVGTWKKADLIEDGLVWECSQPIEFATAGSHTVSLKSNIPLKVARLIPTGYVKSKIPISSSAYYDRWIEMHQSPEKQAALAWFQQARFGMFIHWGVYSEAAGSWNGQKIEEGGAATRRRVDHECVQDSSRRVHEVRSEI